ncbi:SH3 domain-containing protein [Aquimarina brevivitae]|uniref:SH3 domain-containing protein n=1 Tax=Aquimarina brevivitae TaxID=323412 RepID=A0A4Q7PHZ5_9FLAO|nr:SH3 domain-containing protein [Aquimarina brevivitae]RZT00185.1 SH3 domain-containing protein [Aquimarina brevivitae]
MKKMVCAVLLLTTVLYAQDRRTYHSPYQDLELGYTHYLFGDQVKFRAQPDVNAEVLNLLAIGTAVTVLEKTDQTLVYHGMSSPFYKVRYKDQLGYVLGGLIAIDHKVAGDTKLLFAYQKEEEAYSVLYRVVDQDQKYTAYEVPLATADFSIELYDNKGVSGVDQILYINYLAEACGINGGGIYFFKVANRWIKAFEVAKVSEAVIFWTEEELIFPEDENGIPNKIIYQQEIGEYKDEATNWTEVKKVSRELEWKNGQLVPNVRLE